MESHGGADAIKRLWRTECRVPTLDSWTAAQSGWIKTAPNYETEKERMRLPHIGERDRQTKQIEHTLI